MPSPSFLSPHSETVTKINSMSLDEMIRYSFDHMIEHGEQSRCDINDICLYKSLTGKTCAVGCFITDKDYKPNLEAQPVSRLIPAGVDEERMTALRTLQKIHDHATDDGQNFLTEIKKQKEHYIKSGRHYIKSGRLDIY